MYFEHIIYSAAIAIIVGLIFLRYTGRDQAWVIIPISLLPDIDHINNIIWDFGLLPVPQKLVPFLDIGLLHNLMGVAIISVFVVAILSLVKMRFTDAIIYSVIGLTAHLFEDYLVYPATYHFLYPINSAPYGLNIIPETSDMIIAGSQVLIVGLIFFASAICLRYYLMSNGWLHKKEDSFNEPLLEREGV
jgi:membrane-bound metal-dependent hydrolase YbcI (DUF457 family)